MLTSLSRYPVQTLNLFEAVEDVDQRQRDLGDAVEAGDVAGGDGIEPTGPARPSGRGAVLATALADRLPVSSMQLGRERPGPDAGAVGLVDGDDRATWVGATPAPWQAPAAVGEDDVTYG